MYDGSKNLVASSAQLRGQPPALPSGVLDYTRQHGEDRVTWSPEPPDVRVAAVVVSYSGSSQGFVLAARSLRETEVRESQMLQFAQLAGIITLVVMFIAVAFGEYVFGEGKG
ncbi:MAG: hypothetical protein HZB20_12760 [Chloroflexi bacterium]|nr:hypothetical protein [Chloroflexota bacterium]MBI5830376.1 hypothetical protein [Chloroflexota bacterium]